MADRQPTLDGIVTPEMLDADKDVAELVNMYTLAKKSLPDLILFSQRLHDVLFSYGFMKGKQEYRRNRGSEMDYLFVDPFHADVDYRGTAGITLPLVRYLAF